MVAALGLAAVLVAGGLVASNMGFKANYALEGPNSPTSQSGGQTIALPYFQQTNINVVEDLINDINLDTPFGSGDVTDNVQSVSRILRTDDSFDTYSLFTGGNNFGIVPGEGYVISMRGTQTNYIIVGSHNPSLGIQLDGPGENGSQSGGQAFAVPYHFTGTVAEDLINDIEGQGGSIQSVSRIVRMDDSFDTYSLLTGGNNFTLEPGEAYIIAAITGVNYVPSHY